MKKKIFYFSTLLITNLCLFTCIALNDHIYNFNAENVVKNIKYLSSSSFEGRRSGSDENLLAGEIIKNKFKDLATACKCPKDIPICVCGGVKKFKIKPL